MPSLHRLSLCTVFASTMLLAFPAASSAQEAAVTTSPTSVVPHLIKYSGALPSAPSKAEVVDVKFSLYAAQTGGEALWSETQQVSLDAAGKYSVVLGSTTAAGVPDSVFANGQARWMGVTLGAEQESARTVLVATPYSLKASDSETLGGHPVSDFKLKNALPAGGTDVTQIDGTNGVVVNGSGTGPTVTLGLSSSYLQSLGNQIYPQLGGTNKLTGKNTYTAGNLLLGTSPVLSAANVTGTSPVTATVSGNTVKIGLSDSAILALGNSVYAQLGANNAFSGANTFSKVISFASGQTFPGTAALSGNNNFTGSNTFSKAITFASGQTFPGTGSGTITGITTTSPLSGSGTSGSVALSLNTSALESTLNGVYPQLSVNNTFSGQNTFNGISYFNEAESTIQFYVQTAEPNVFTIVGENFGRTQAGGGVYGLNDSPSGKGVYAWSIPQGGTAAGVYGVLGGSSSIGAARIDGWQGAGVWADSGDQTGGNSRSTALVATSDSDNAGVFLNNAGGFYTLYAENDAAGGPPFYAQNTNDGGVCSMSSIGNFACDGGFTNDVISKTTNKPVAVHSVSSPENWIEDFGSSALGGGAAHIAIEPGFLGTVNTSVEYHVFLTPEGDCKGLYIASKGPDGFDVRELGGGTSNVAFSYRIVAKHTGMESARLEDMSRIRELGKNQGGKRAPGQPLTYPAPAKPVLAKPALQAASVAR